MAGVSRAAIEDRLALMAREIDAIESSRPATLEEYLSAENETARIALEHRLFLVIQAMLDIAAHITASRGYGVPATYREALIKLGDVRIIEPALAESLAGASGLRNAIAHAYLELDQERVFDALHRTDELKRFAASIWTWAEGQ